MPRRFIVPSCCLHKPTGQAYVRLSGQTIYLGKYESAESKTRCRQLLAEFPTPESRKNFIPKSEANTKLTVAEVCARYWLFAKEYYSADELGVIRAAHRPLTDLHGTLPAEQFGASAFKAVRSYIIQEGDRRRGKKLGAGLSVEQPQPRKPISRSYVNRLAGYIRRIFKWGVANELIPVTTYQTLLTVDGLRKGRTPGLKETKRVKPVAMATVEQTLPYLQPELVAVVRLQLLTGARPDEITIIRPCDLNLEHELWEYRPRQHKTQSREGNDEKVILMGVQAQAVLAPFFRQCESPTDYVFSPKRVVARINQAKRGSGRYIKRNYTPRQPARRLLTLRPACSLDHPRRPLPKYFNACRYLLAPLWLLPPSDRLAGWDSHPLEIAELHGVLSARHIQRVPLNSRHCENCGAGHSRSIIGRSHQSCVDDMLW